MNDFYKNRKAMTFVEIMCVLIIISIVSSIALPSINNFRSSERCKSEASILVSYIRQAKYQAIQDNTLNRIIFYSESQNNYDGNLFKVQVYNGGLNFDDKIKENDNDYDLDNDWNSIADTDEVELNSSVEVDISELVNSGIDVIYFKPDGYLYYCSDNTNPQVSYIPEKSISFKYGSAALAVNINALGVISSEVIANNEDEEYFEDGYDTSTDTDSNYSDDYGD